MRKKMLANVVKVVTIDRRLVGVAYRIYRILVLVSLQISWTCIWFSYMLLYYVSSFMFSFWNCFCMHSNAPFIPLSSSDVCVPNFPSELLFLCDLMYLYLCIYFSILKAENGVQYWVQRSLDRNTGSCARVYCNCSHNTIGRVHLVCHLHLGFWIIFMSNILNFKLESSLSGSSGRESSFTGFLLSSLGEGKNFLLWKFSMQLLFVKMNCRSLTMPP